MVVFHNDVRSLETLGGVARRVFARYGYDGPTADMVLHTLESVHEAITKTRGDLIQFIERAIATGSTHEVQASAGTDSVTVQTIHATKGLEYPIVILARMNSERFPPGGGTSAGIAYDDSIGLRQRKVYSEEAHGRPHVYDNWQGDVLQKCLPRNYDEERRLLYVAITRAESHVVFSAGEDPNSFIEELPVEVAEVSLDVDEQTPDPSEQTALQVDIPVPEGPQGQTPHTLMNDDVFDGVDGGRGTEFGSQVHDFAEAYALGDAVTPRNADEDHVKRFLDQLEGELLVEEEVYLPVSVGDDRVTVSGIVDLVHVTSDQVEIVDYKTDRGRHAETEYRKQLSVYYHVAQEVYPDREVTASIFYTETGDRQQVDPLPVQEIQRLVRETTF
jgi:ATP-dependent exoDNAse (exonuclease V) beta subunit